MTLLEKAIESINAVDSDPDASARVRLESLKVLRDLVEDHIWDLKLATGLGLWKKDDGGF